MTDKSGRSCANCGHFRDFTQPSDEANWGECWANPPQWFTPEGEDPVCMPAQIADTRYICRHWKANQ